MKNKNADNRNSNLGNNLNNVTSHLLIPTPQRLNPAYTHGLTVQREQYQSTALCNSLTDGILLLALPSVESI